MATVTITIKDEGRGLNIKLESDPPFPGPAAEDQTATNAQHLGFVGLNAITNACKSEGVEEGEEEGEE